MSETKRLTPIQILYKERVALVKQRIAATVPLGATKAAKLHSERVRLQLQLKIDEIDKELASFGFQRFR